jgi:hypothetical protein
VTHERVLVAELILLGFHFPNSLVCVEDDVVVVGGHRGDGRCPVSGGGSAGRRRGRKWPRSPPTHASRKAQHAHTVASENKTYEAKNSAAATASTGTRHFSAAKHQRG